MTLRRPPRVAAAIAAGLAEGHRFRDDILGDLEDEYRRRAAVGGQGAAGWWYRREAVRVPIAPAVALRLVVLAGVGYEAVLGAAASAGRLYPSSAWALLVIGVSAAVAGRVVARVAGRLAIPAMCLFWALALGVGGPYLVRGARAELWLHVAKVTTVLVASGLGVWWWTGAYRAVSGRRPRRVRP